jgi:general secretion pathway protein D
VIIAAPADEQRRLADLVHALDLPQRQVLVEAIIVEVSDEVAQKLGVQMLIGGKDAPFAVTSFSNGAANILDLAGGLYADRLDQTTTVINGATVTTSTTSATADSCARTRRRRRWPRAGHRRVGDKPGRFGLFRHADRCRAGRQQFQRAVHPHIVTNDNVPASILFGKEIPVATGEALSNSLAGAFRTIQRQNVGIELDVTPQINAGQAVRLDLRQQVSSVAGPVSSSNGELVVNKREIRTTVTVGDGEIIALGGLLDDAERRTLEKCLCWATCRCWVNCSVAQQEPREDQPDGVHPPDDPARRGRARGADGPADGGGARRAGGVRAGAGTSIDELVADYLGVPPARCRARPQCRRGRGDRPARGAPAGRGEERRP